jgi:hypothetical protein
MVILLPYRLESCTSQGHHIHFSDNVLMPPPPQVAGRSINAFHHVATLKKASLFAIAFLPYPTAKMLITHLPFLSITFASR